MPSEAGGRERSPIVTELGVCMGRLADGEVAPVPDVPSGAEMPGTSARASPPVSEAALRKADELLGLAQPGSRAGAAAPEPLDDNSTGVRLLVAGREVAVPPRGVALGRQPGSGGIVIGDDQVSRRHALVQRTATGMSVIDLGSMNGTMVVRGEVSRRADGQGTPVTDGDRIMTASGVLLAEVVAESPDSQS